jgi:hypothetical protein
MYAKPTRLVFKSGNIVIPKWSGEYKTGVELFTFITKYNLLLILIISNRLILDCLYYQKLGHIVLIII